MYEVCEFDSRYYEFTLIFITNYSPMDKELVIVLPVLNGR